MCFRQPTCAAQRAHSSNTKMSQSGSCTALAFSSVVLMPRKWRIFTIIAWCTLHKLLSTIFSLLLLLMTFCWLLNYFSAPIIARPRLFIIVFCATADAVDLFSAFKSKNIEVEKWEMRTRRNSWANKSQKNELERDEKWNNFNKLSEAKMWQNEIN